MSKIIYSVFLSLIFLVTQAVAAKDFNKNPNSTSSNASKQDVIIMKNKQKFELLKI